LELLYGTDFCERVGLGRELCNFDGKEVPKGLLKDATDELLELIARILVEEDVLKMNELNNEHESET
jgi:hypothetical protein